MNNWGITGPIGASLLGRGAPMTNGCFTVRICHKLVDWGISGIIIIIIVYIIILTSKEAF